MDTVVLYVGFQVARVAVQQLVSQRRPSVEVNLNAISSDGLVRVRASSANRAPRIGQRIRVFDRDDETEGSATVSRINENTGLMYLDVDWSTLRDLVGVVEDYAEEAEASEASTATTVVARDLTFAKDKPVRPATMN